MAEISRKDQKMLPPMTLQELYEQFCLWAADMNSTPSSLSTFCKVWRQQCWQAKLQVRSPVVLSRCQVCDDIAQARRQTHDPKQRQQLGNVLLQHVKEQQEDRLVYKAIREASRTGTSILSLILDGMDQAKFKVPRVKNGTNFLGNNSWRPQLHVSCCIAHGYMDMYWVGDENIPKDAAATVQQLSEMLDAVAKLRSDRNQKLQDHLVIQLDNTCRENKNNLVLRWGACLVGRGVFKSVSLHYLRKGHTHEDVDQRFKILATRLSRATLLENPEDFRTLMRTSLQAPAGQLLEVREMKIPYDWWRYYSSVRAFPFDLHGHTGPKACHVFRFLKWDTLSEVINSSASPLQSGDVILCTKHYMRDAIAAQPPLVVIPATSLSSLPVGCPQVVSSRIEMSKLQAKEYKKTAAACIRPPWTLVKASRYLEEYVTKALAGSCSEKPGSM